MSFLVLPCKEIIIYRKSGHVVLIREQNNLIDTGHRLSNFTFIFFCSLIDSEESVTKFSLVFFYSLIESAHGCRKFSLPFF